MMRCSSCHINRCDCHCWPSLLRSFVG